MRPQLCPGLALALLVAGPPAFPRGLASTDVLRMRSAGDVAMAPDGTRLAYTIERSDRPGRPEKQLFVLTVADGKSVRVGGENDTGGGAWFSPDGRWIAFKGKIDGKDGLHRRARGRTGRPGSSPRSRARTPR